MEEKYLYCPLTKLFFYDPVVAEDGNIYEYLAIKEWMKTSSISPVSGNRMGRVLIKISIIKNLVNEYLNLHPELKEKQFFFKKPFHLFRDEVFRLIDSGNYDKLCEYNDFVLSTVYKTHTIFEEICKKCSDDVVIYVIDHSVDYDAPSHDGNYPIHTACTWATAGPIIHLIHKKVELNKMGKKNIPINLVFIHQKERLEILKEMHKYGAMLTDDFAYKPVHYLARKVDNHFDFSCFNYMLAHGIDMETETIDGQRPLHILCQHCCYKEDLIAFLTKYDVDLGAKLKNNKTFLELLVENTLLNQQDKNEILYVYYNKMFTKHEEKFEDELSVSVSSESDTPSILSDSDKQEQKPFIENPMYLDKGKEEAEEEEIYVPENSISKQPLLLDYSFLDDVVAQDS